MLRGNKQFVKVLAITGAAHGIGKAIAELFAQNGYAVSSIDPEATPVDTDRRVDVRGDIADEDAIAQWMRETVERFGPPSLLVNNAGTEHNVPFLELAVRDFDRVLAVNLRGAFLCAQSAANAMVKAKVHGSIINIASTRAFQSEPNTEAYSASKGGMVALTHAMAMSLAPYRIRVNCVCPGWIETRKAPVSSPRDGEQHPVGRVGEPRDVAQACWYLAEHAPFMTGQRLILDGGMSVKMIYEE